VNAGEALVRVLLTQEGVHEDGYSNRGKVVSEYQRHDELPGEGYAWCVSFVQWGAALLGIEMPSRTASVGLLEAACRKAGLMVDRPQRGDLGFLRLDADSWPDHQLVVTGVVQLGPLVGIRTIEGNTSPEGVAGSQGNGGTVAQRLRFVSRSKVTFARLPGTVTDARCQSAIELAQRLRGRKPHPVKKVVQKVVPARRPLTDADWQFGRWYLGLGEYKKVGARHKPSRPKRYPARVPDTGWRAVKWYHARVKAAK
jgi:hypothetical protein